MWTDIDYMDNYLDFTWDPVKFPRDQFAAFVDALHARNQHFVVIVDPGISNTSGYAAYEQGRAQGVFIQRSAAAGGGEFHGRVWPGFTAFPDWFAPNASAWWRDQVAAFLKGVAYDGLWIDMNEISNFCTGSCDPRRARVSANARAGFDPLNPPYAIDNMDKSQNHHVPLNGFTIDADCPHGSDPRLIEYNTHNLFGMMEGIATAAALEQVTGKRSLVISRSTFAGAGHHNGHWLGDNDATWDSMRQSIAGVLAMNLFGIPLVGADVCGFNGDTTEELCARWSALGAFYPFSRNHNAIGRIPQVR
jgi:alpha-glucosidase (family GH31 glycosyl hydrolase)